MGKPSAPADEPIGLLAAAIRSAVRRFVASRTQPLGLSTQQFWFLVGVAEHPCQSQAELAARLRLDEATACRAIRSLALRRLIRTERDAVDRRRVRIALTAEGERLSTALLSVAAQVRAAVDSALQPEERERTRDALRKILAALERIRADAPAPAVRSGPRRRAPARA
jgi:DNA-binding MarR family transcriptional regulator